MNRITHLVCALCLGAAVAMAAAPATPALAKQRPSSKQLSNEAVKDCYSHGRLTRHYTKAELREALATIPAYVEQYSNCESVLESALTNGTVKPNGTGGGGGSSISTPVIIVIVVVVLAIVTFGGILIRRRRGLADRGSAGDAPTKVIEPPTEVIDPDRPATGDGEDGGDGGSAS
jgi:hypothetical protein